MSYIFNNSFHKNLNYLSLNNLDQTTTRLHSSLGRAYNLLEYDEIVVFNNYAQMAIDTYIDMNNFNYTISCFD